MLASAVRQMSGQSLEQTGPDMSAKTAETNVTLWKEKEEGENMTLEEFERAVRHCDFAIGDSFWINDVEFEVVNRR